MPDHPRPDLPPHLRDHPNLILDHRPNVALVIRNHLDQLLWCERLDFPGSWQFPQGGVDPGEPHTDAMWREGSEELGLPNPRDHLTIERVAPHTLLYDFPPHIIERFLSRGRPSFLGQAQRFYLLRFSGPDALITLEPPPGQHREFSSFQWADASLLARCPPFKRSTYQRALHILGLLP